MASAKKNRNLIDMLTLFCFQKYKTIRDKLAHSNNKYASKAYLYLKMLERKHITGRYTFVSFDELLVWTLNWIKTFPTTYDLIIGIPRSGLLVASIIALKLGKPLTTPELMVKNKYWMSKRARRKTKLQNILLVDDSITDGKTMKESLKLIRAYNKKFNITKAALIATEESKDFLDLYYKIIPHPRLFEWNLLHSKKGKIATDLDGVICENCPPGVDSNEELYLNWLKTARPYLIPAFEIDAIISCRLQKYRKETEEWLAKHNVRYKKLILWDILSKQERKGRNAKYKIEALLKIKPDLFWESSLYEAKQIWNATKIPTLCVDEMILFS